MLSVFWHWVEWNPPINTIDLINHIKLIRLFIYLFFFFLKWFQRLQIKQLANWWADTITLNADDSTRGSNGRLRTDSSAFIKETEGATFICYVKITNWKRGGEWREPPRMLSFSQLYSYTGSHLDPISNYKIRVQVWSWSFRRLNCESISSCVWKHQLDRTGTSSNAAGHQSKCKFGRHPTSSACIRLINQRWVS